MSATGPDSGFFKDSNLVYHCREFENLKWLEHGFPTSRALAVPLPITTLRQIHSDQVVDAKAVHDRTAEGDALVTHQVGQRIGVRTADCVPILLVDANTRAVAAVPAGWRGTLAGIASKAVLRLCAEFGTDPADVHVAIGPAIGACCYEVGVEVAERFSDIFAGSVPLRSPNGRPLLDLIEANRRTLIAASVPEHQVYSSGLCTYCCRNDFFSYRRDPANPGRMTSYIGRRE
jgi:purine-nucleoside/S-methyl-5'-thioadenosine phosphorylase / adenosine deaminase